MIRSFALAAAALTLAACHTDPFSVKPEVRGVTVPDKAPPAETEGKETAPAKDAGTAKP